MVYVWSRFFFFNIPLRATAPSLPKIVDEALVESVRCHSDGGESLEHDSTCVFHVFATK